MSGQVKPNFIHAPPPFFSMDGTTISVARNGAGAKKCRGPAPGKITNKLSIRNISFYSGAGSYEKTAPAPCRQSTCATLTVHLRRPGTISSIQTGPFRGRTGKNAISSMKTPPFSWTKWQNHDLIHENRAFSWTKPPSPLHGMAQVRKNAEDLHRGKLLTS